MRSSLSTPYTQKHNMCCCEGNTAAHGLRSIRQVQWLLTVIWAKVLGVEADADAVVCFVSIHGFSSPIIFLPLEHYVRCWVVETIQEVLFEVKNIKESSVAMLDFHAYADLFRLSIIFNPIESISLLVIHLCPQVNTSCPHITHLQHEAKDK